MDTALPENFDKYNLSTLSCIVFHVSWKFLNNAAITKSTAGSYSERSTARKAVSASPSYFSHVGSQTLGEVRHRLVSVFLWQLFPGSLQGGLQLILGFGWSSYGTFQRSTAYFAWWHGIDNIIPFGFPHGSVI